MVRLKRIWSMLIMVTLLFATACSGKNSLSGKLPEEYAHIVVPETADRIDQKTLDEISEWVSSDPIRLGFLESTYDDVKDVDLYSLFYFGDGTDYNMPLNDLRSFLLKYGWWGDFSVSSITTQQMDAELRSYTGLGLEDTSKNHINALYYLEDSDRYYSLHGDLKPKEFKPGFGFIDEGVIFLFYPNSLFVQTRMDGIFCLTLKETEDGYQYIGNKYCKDDGKTITYSVEIYNELKDEIAISDEQIDIVQLEEEPKLSSSSIEEAVKNITEQDGFKETSVTGQNWIDISQYGRIMTGVIKEKTYVYYVTNSGTVYNLPTFKETVTPSELLFGGGGQIFEYMVESDAATSAERVTDWYGTILLETNELFIRTVTVEMSTQAG